MRIFEKEYRTMIPGNRLKLRNVVCHKRPPWGDGVGAAQTIISSQVWSDSTERFALIEWPCLKGHSLNTHCL